MKEQLCYMDEIRPSYWRILPIVSEVLFELFLVFYYISLLNIDGTAVNVDLENVQREKIRLIIFMIAFVIVIYADIARLRKRFKEHKSILKDRADFKSRAVVHRGRIVDTEMLEDIKFRRARGLPVKVREFYGIIEFYDKGGKVTFKTPRLCAYPKFLNTKEMNVYAYNSDYYATNFGTIERPKRRIKDLFWWMEGEE